MSNSKNRLLKAAIGLYFSAAVTVFNPVFADELPFAVSDMMSRSPVPEEQTSLWIAPVDSDTPIVDWHSQIPRPPASITKVITTGVGLLLLGENYRWRTEFYTNGSLQNGTLTGDLFIKGYGNPYLVEENLMDMVVELRQRGIKQINGRIVLDNTYFILNDEDPDAFDGHGMEAYNAIPNALNVNFHTVKVDLNATARGVSVTTNPELSYLTINNQMKLSRNGRCRGSGFAPNFSYDSQTQTLTATGTMSRSCHKQALTRVLGDAGDIFFSLFKQAWLQTGGDLHDRWLYGKVPAGMKLIYQSESQPLYEQIQPMNKLSNNLMTRQLFLTIGAELTQPPATLVKSRAVAEHKLKQLGVDTRGLMIDNGSGLSRQTRLSAKQLGTFLQAMYRSPVRPFFEQSLSVMGVDGTLKRRLRGTPLQGNAIGKTGTLGNAKTLVGYVTAKSGRKFVYAIMFEGRAAKAGRPMMDDLLQWIYAQY